MKLKTTLFSLLLGFAALMGVALFGDVDQALACNQQASSFFGIRDWHHYLPCDASGGIDNSALELSSVWLIALAIFESMLRIGGLLAVIFIIWGGVKYITSMGSPDGTATARKTIINAIAGLIITISASVLVTFMIDLLTGGAGIATGDLNIPTTAADSSVIETVFRFVYAIVAVVSVVYIVVASIKFATSTGDPQKAASARNTIIYAIVGLIVVLVANIITSAVLNEVDQGPPTPPDSSYNTQIERHS